ncbi:hypothetical protein C2S53_001151 [Perilla frutescens var. hirtella]|uniref:Uncharacterized protein n=1 Tax=Perilla frutescens var. hirtella TaxID=608512 RepID=A0AAD4JLY9_PERFH|nr:hypothetical protein C2S53_001151 [Perilla frutescens var. hirtella]
MNNVSIIALGDAISYILSAESIRGEYQIYCLSTSRSGRMLRSIIGSDTDLARLFTMEPEPTVYLVHNQNIEDTQPEPFTIHVVVTQPESSTHYPINTQPNPYSYVPQFDCSVQPSFNPTDEDIEHFERSNWLSDNWCGSESGKEPQYEVKPTPNTDAAEGTTFYDATSTDYADRGFPFHDARNDDAAADDNGVVEIDDDNNDEADLDVQSEDDDEPFRTGFSNCMFHDFTA